MKAPVNLSLDDYRTVNDIALKRRGKRWKELTTPECHDLIAELHDEVAALQDRVDEFTANNMKDES